MHGRRNGRRKNNNKQYHNDPQVHVLGMIQQRFGSIKEQQALMGNNMNSMQQQQALIGNDMNSIENNIEYLATVLGSRKYSHSQPLPFINNNHQNHCANSQSNVNNKSRSRLRVQHDSYSQSRPHRGLNYKANLRSNISNDNLNDDDESLDNEDEDEDYTVIYSPQTIQIPSKFTRKDLSKTLKDDYNLS